MSSIMQVHATLTDSHSYSFYFKDYEMFATVDFPNDRSLPIQMVFTQNEETVARIEFKDRSFFDKIVPDFPSLIQSINKSLP